VRVLKWISLGLGALVGLAVIGVLVVVWFVDPNSFKSRIESAVRDATGRELTLAGDIDLALFPWLSLRTGEGRLGNAEGFGAEPMISWQSAQLGARLLPLLRGELVADRITLRGADVRLVRRSDGVANWEGLGGAAGDQAAGSEPMELKIGGIRVSDSRISYLDETAGGREIRIESFAFSTDEIVPGEALTDTEIEGVLHVTGFAPEGIPFRVEVPELIAPKDFSAVQVDEYELVFGSLEIEGGAGGKLDPEPRIEGRFETNVFDLRALLGNLGVAAPATSDPGTLRELAIAATWTYDAGAIALDPLSLRVDDTRFTGHFRMNGDESRAGTFELRGDRLDLARYVPPPDPASEPFVLPTATLKALAFSGLVELEEATLEDVTLKGVSLRLLLDEAGLRPVSPQRAP
jgi:AsmA protein